MPPKMAPDLFLICSKILENLPANSTFDMNRRQRAVGWAGWWGGWFEAGNDSLEEAFLQRRLTMKWVAMLQEVIGTGRMHRHPFPPGRLAYYHPLQNPSFSNPKMGWGCEPITTLRQPPRDQPPATPLRVSLLPPTAIHHPTLNRSLSSVDQSVLSSQITWSSQIPCRRLMERSNGCNCGGSTVAAHLWFETFLNRRAH